MKRRTHRSDSGFAGGEVDKTYGYYVPRRYWASRLAPYAGEWAAWLATLVVGALTHGWLGDSAALPAVTPLLMALGIGLAGVAWVAGAARGKITRIHAVVTILASTCWLIAATVTGATAQVTLLAWVFGGASLALSWNIRRALSGGDEDSNGALFEKVKLAGIKAKEIEANPNKVSARLQLPAGETTVTEVQKASEQLSGALRLHKGAVRITGDPDDASQARMTVVPVDTLKNPQPWTGPSVPGGSIAEPLVVGLYEDNEPQRLYLPGDKVAARNATHYQVVGMNGSGKTHGAKLAWTEVLTRRDACLIILDPAKGEQSVGFLGNDNAHVVLGEKPCREFVRRLPHVIEQRATQLGRWGFDQWLPEAYRKHWMPYLVLWIEEATRVLEDADTLTKIAEALRSAGGSLILSLQRASFRRMSTDVRSQLGGAWCFGVSNIDDAAFSLSDEVIEAGAQPDRWRNRRPGCNYLEGPGIEEDRLVVPGRTFTVTDRELLVSIEDAAIVRPALDELTARGLGLPQRPGEDEPAKPAGPTDESDEFDPDSLDGLHPLTDEEDESVLPLPENHEPDLEVDLDAAVPGDDVDMPLPEGRPTRREALRIVTDHIARMGGAEFTVRDLPDPDQVLGRSRSWLSGELSRMADHGELVRVREDSRACVYRAPAHDVRNAA